VAMTTTIMCRWCGRPIGMKHYELFAHVSCTRLEVAVPPDMLAPGDREAGERAIHE
jgi:hypothetical protein